LRRRGRAIEGLALFWERQRPDRREEDHVDGEEHKATAANWSARRTKSHLA
jgi:hypothetical protein